MKQLSKSAMKVQKQDAKLDAKMAKMNIPDLDKAPSKKAPKNTGSSKKAVPAVKASPSKKGGAY